MASFKVTASKLNLRLAPVEDFRDKSNVIGKLVSDAPFESVNEKTNKLGRWLQDVNGHWAWEGGMEDLVMFDATKMSWAHDSVENGGLGIVDLWNLMGVRGENINVLILDTGISKNTNQFIRDGISIVKANLCINELNKIDDIDGHGTNSASIVGATGNLQSDNVLFGIAPGVNLYIIKFAGSINANAEKLKAGLNLIDPKWQIDIISISFCFGTNDFDDFFKNSISENCVVLSALNHPESGNISLNNNQFPAIYDNVIPIAASTKQLNQIINPCELIDNPNKSNWIFPGENIKVLNEDGVLSNANQTSIATPFGAGVIALFLSYMKKNQIPINKNSINTLFKLIDQTGSLPKTISIINDGVQKDVKTCFCNPVNAFNQFNNFFKSQV